MRIEAGGKIYLYPLDRDRIIEVEGPIGITEVHIENNLVYIHDSLVRINSASCQEVLIKQGSGLHVFQTVFLYLSKEKLMRKLMTLTTEEKKTAALLAAFCMFLSILEYLIPKPLPFMRIGLANLPVLLSLVLLPVRGTALVVFLKVLGQGLINGTLFSYIFVFQLPDP